MKHCKLLPIVRPARKLYRRSILRLSICALFAAGLFAASPLFAQQKSDFAGDYAGTLGPYHVKLHVLVSADGTVGANVDSPDQNLFALACTDLSINGQILSFSVPNVRGEWMGTLSTDHASLSGIWKQGGRPMPLNFTRGGAASPLTANPTPVVAATPQIASPPPASASGSSHPECSGIMTMNYWNGSAWKTMIVASHIAGDTGVSFKEGLKNPFNPRAGYTSILVFKGSAAALQLDPKPTFCVTIQPSMDPTVIKIGLIDLKKGNRELETCTGPCASKGRSSDDWMPDKRVQPVDYKRLSDKVVEITPRNPLPPGQYIIGGPGIVMGYYDFGVGSGSASQ